MTSTRERKERFINSFGDRKARDAIMDMFARRGLGMLSDEQIEEITQDMVQDARSAVKRNRESRAAYQAFSRRSEAQGAVL